MKKLQGIQSFFIEGEDFISVPGGAGEFSPLAFREDGITEIPSETAERSRFKFGRIFPRSQAAQVQGVADSIYKDLGKAMEKVPDSGDNPDLPSGYTYLAQFIAHDMSFLKEEALPDGPVDIDEIGQLRSPSLDLDSLYRGGPASSRELYKDDLIRMKIGLTETGALGGVNKPFENDLPRSGSGSPNPRKAVIADPRNDDNLLVAQTHVAFMKFHNAVADHLEKKNGAGQVSFEEVSEKVVRHYQWIVLHDLLPRIIDRAILGDVIDNPSKRHFRVGPGKSPFMPVEFAFAAFRMGHCLVRDQYELNRVFESPQQGQRGPVKLHDLFNMTGFRGRMRGLSNALPGNWIIDWTRFYDFSHFGIPRNPKFNLAKLISARLAPALGVLPNFVANISRQEFLSLAATDLIRGSRLGLPTGQELAGELGKAALSPDQILQSPNPDIPVILKKNGFDEQTPLWYYILKEAEVSGGRRLGPVGSRIIAETFVGLIEASQPSILDGGGWRPDLGQIKAEEFEMADLLIFVDRFLNKPDPSVSELNPIG